MKKYTSLLLLFAFIICKAHGQEETQELVTDRPDQTESAQIVPMGSLQIETGFMIEDDGPFTNYTYNTSLFRYGINKNFELRLITEYLGTKTQISGSPETSANGFSPLSFGTKIKIAKANGIIPEMAFLGHITFRTGSKEFQPDFIAPDFRFSMEYDLSEKFSLGVNLGAEWDGVNPNATGIYTLVGGAGLSEKIGLFVELYGFVSEQTDQPDHRFNAGLTYMISDLIQFDVSGGFGLSGISPDNFISTGISFRTPR
jgi:hypothetical protein